MWIINCPDNQAVREYVKAASDMAEKLRLAADATQKAIFENGRRLDEILRATNGGKPV